MSFSVLDVRLEDALRRHAWLAADGLDVAAVVGQLTQVVNLDFQDLFSKSPSLRHYWSEGRMYRWRKPLYFGQPHAQ